ncbi:MAG: hypothetical protein QW587_09110 [Candidatus Bathyarchaeia archaeon]
MRESLRFEDYLTYAELRSLLASLNPGDMEQLTAQVEHFTVKEAEHRDEIVLAYFGEEGIARIADTGAGGNSELGPR